MKVNIIKIIEAGNLDKERVVMKCDSEEEIGEYILLRTGVFGDGVNSDVNRAFWFPDKEISKGDYIVLYSKLGLPKEKVTGPFKYHFFYWNSDVALWNGNEHACVIMHAPDWNSFNPNSDP